MTEVEGRKISAVVGLNIGATFTETAFIISEGDRHVEVLDEAFETNIAVRPERLDKMFKAARMDDTATLTLRDLENLGHEACRDLFRDLNADWGKTMTWFQNNPASYRMALWKPLIAGHIFEGEDAHAHVELVDGEYAYVVGDRRVTVGVCHAIFIYYCIVELLNFANQNPDVANLGTDTLTFSSISHIAFAVPNAFTVDHMELYRQAAHVAGLQHAQIGFIAESAAGMTALCTLHQDKLRCPIKGRNELHVALVDCGGYTNDVSLCGIERRSDGSYTVRQKGYEGNAVAGYALTRKLVRLLPDPDVMTPTKVIAMERFKLDELGSSKKDDVGKRRDEEGSRLEELREKDVHFNVTLDGVTQQQILPAPVYELIIDNADEQIQPLLSLMAHDSRLKLDQVIFTGQSNKSYLLQEAFMQQLKQRRKLAGDQKPSSLDSRNTLVVKGAVLHAAKKAGWDEVSYHRRSHSLATVTCFDVLPHNLSLMVNNTDSGDYTTMPLLPRFADKGATSGFKSFLPVPADDPNMVIVLRMVAIQLTVDSRGKIKTQPADIFDTVRIVKLPDVFTMGEVRPEIHFMCTFLGQQRLHLRFSALCTHKQCENLATTVIPEVMVVCDHHIPPDATDTIPFEAHSTELSFNAFARPRGQVGVEDFFRNVIQRMSAADGADLTAATQKLWSRVVHNDVPSHQTMKELLDLLKDNGHIIVHDHPVWCPSFLEPAASTTAAGAASGSARGRSSATNTAKPGSASASSTAEALTARKRRGRPPGSKSSAAEAPRKKRGRPPGSAKSLGGEAVQKKRGRPPGSKSSGGKGQKRPAAAATKSKSNEHASETNSDSRGSHPYVTVQSVTPSQCV